MATVGAEEAIHVQNTGHLSDRDIARATGAAPDTVREWLTGRSAPGGEGAERLAELSSIVQRLARVIRPTYIPESQPNQFLGQFADTLFTNLRHLRAPQMT
jgi:transcriptional regulator with XRE-family HTH domain